MKQNNNIGYLITVLFCDISNNVIISAEESIYFSSKRKRNSAVKEVRDLALNYAKVADQSKNKCVCLGVTEIMPIYEDLTSGNMLGHRLVDTDQIKNIEKLLIIKFKLGGE